MSILGAAPSASADDFRNDPANFAWQAGAIAHAQRMREFVEPDAWQSDDGGQTTPSTIDAFTTYPDPSGAIATLAPAATQTSQNAFFADLGTNQRTCFTCHQPQNGWGLSAADARVRYASSRGRDPLFRLVDGATCPNADVSTATARAAAYRLLLERGLIRVGLPIPDDTQFRIASVDDPYGCNTNPVTGLTSPTSGIVSVYRRPLPATNLGFLSAIMWDGREPSLSSQAVDATLGHAQGDSPPTAAEQQQIVDFESGLLTAQYVDADAAGLTDRNATGGPERLVSQRAAFFIGINDPLGQNPSGADFTSSVFDLYRAWADLRGGDPTTVARRAVARGEALFNDTSFKITNVKGLNDALGKPSIDGFCGTCHDSPNVGNHSVALPIDIGISNAPGAATAPLDVSQLPVFHVECTSGPLAGREFVVTDLGRALISGKCADIGKLKGPILRGLAARAPFFHNGSAATLRDVVEFYDKRFAIGFTDQQKSDLAAFLATL